MPKKSSESEKQHVLLNVKQISNNKNEMKKSDESHSSTPNVHPALNQIKKQKAMTKNLKQIPSNSEKQKNAPKLQEVSTKKMKNKKPDEAKISTKIEQIPENPTQPITVDKKDGNKKKKSVESLNSSKEYIATQKDEGSANMNVELDQKQDKPKNKKNKKRKLEKISKTGPESLIDPQKVSLTSRL